MGTAPSAGVIKSLPKDITVRTTGLSAIVACRAFVVLTQVDEAKAFDLMINKFKINPKETIYIEDIAKNLSIAKKRGSTTVWLINNEYWGKKESESDYIDYKIENLSLFL